MGGAGALGEGGRKGRAGVLEIVQGTVVLPDDGVEVAVAVEVGEARLSVGPRTLHIDAVERIGGGRARGEGGRDGRAGGLRRVRGSAVALPARGVGGRRRRGGGQS